MSVDGADTDLSQIEQLRELAATQIAAAESAAALDGLRVRHLGRKAPLPQPMMIPALSAHKISPGLPAPSATSAFQILSKCDCGWPSTKGRIERPIAEMVAIGGRYVNAPGHGTSPRTRFQMETASWLQSIKPSLFLIFGA